MPNIYTTSKKNLFILCNECGKRIRYTESFDGLCYNCDRLIRG
jgi:NMD protein affecting ribosome stability and mRNA decay